MTQMISGIMISFSSIAMLIFSVQHLALNCIGFVAGGWIFLNGKRKFLFKMLSEIFS